LGAGARKGSFERVQNIKYGFEFIKNLELIESSVVNEGKEDLKRLAVESFQIFFIHTGLINCGDEWRSERVTGNRSLSQQRKCAHYFQGELRATRK